MKSKKLPGDVKALLDDMDKVMWLREKNGMEGPPRHWSLKREQIERLTHFFPLGAYRGAPFKAID